MEWIPVVLAGPYNSAYVAAFGVGLALALLAGRRKGWPLLPWLSLLSACAAGGIIGSKVLHFDLSIASAGEKTILGGIVGGALALVVVGRVLRFDSSALDRLLPALTAGFAVGRIGCYLAGCCFGRPTALPWGVVYAPGTDAYQHQLAAGMIGQAASGTLPVHPTQLYEAALSILLAGAVLLCGPRVRRPGSQFLLFACGFAAMRIAIEPLRGAATPNHGLTQVQWTLGATLVGLFLLLLWRERSSFLVQPSGSPGSVSDRSLLVLVAVLALVGFGTPWLTPLERITLLTAAAPALVLAGTRWIRGSALAPAPGLAAMAVFLQVPPQDAPPESSHLFVGASAMTGSYVETCGGAHRYTVGGASLGYKHVTGPAESLTIRGQGFVGRDTPQDPFDGPSETISGFAIAGQVDRLYFGAGLGATTGRLIVDGDAERVLPSARLRVGSLRSFHLEGRLWDHEPVAVPAPALQIGLGYGIGAHGSRVRIGVSDAGFFGGATVATAGGFELEPFLALGDSDIYQAGLALRQRIGGRR